MNSDNPDFEYEEMLRFADAITPANWNIVANTGMYRYVPNTLNIWLDVLEREQVPAYRNSGACETFAGRVKEIMRFFQLDVLRDYVADAAEALAMYGPGSIASIQVQVCRDQGDWRDTLVHELAHVAATRWKAQQLKPVKRDLGYIGHDAENEGHGPIFLKAFRRMIFRTMTTFGDRIRTRMMWWEYCYYADRLYTEEDFTLNPFLQGVPKRMLIEWSMSKIMQEHRKSQDSRD